MYIIVKLQNVYIYKNSLTKICKIYIIYTFKYTHALYKYVLTIKCIDVYICLSISLSLSLSLSLYIYIYIYIYIYMLCIMCLECFLLEILMLTVDCQFCWVYTLYLHCCGSFADMISCVYAILSIAVVYFHCISILPPF